MTGKLDLDNLAAYSAATRAHDAAADELGAAIEAIRTAAADSATGWTRDDIVRGGADLGVTLKAGSPKADLVAAYAKARAEASDEYKSLWALKTQAICDRRMTAARINEDIDHAANLADQLQGKLADAKGPDDVRSAMTWKGDELLKAQCEAALAVRVVTGVEKGMDLREAVQAVTRNAMFTVMGFPSHIQSNGTGGNYRLESTMEAVAAVNFIQRVASMALDDTVPAEWLTR